MIMNDYSASTIYNGQDDIDDSEMLDLCDELGLGDENEVPAGMDLQYSFTEKEAKNLRGASIDLGFDLSEKGMSKAQTGGFYPILSEHGFAGRGGFYGDTSYNIQKHNSFGYEYEEKVPSSSRSSSTQGSGHHAVKFCTEWNIKSEMGTEYNGEPLIKKVEDSFPMNYYSPHRNEVHYSTPTNFQPSYAGHGAVVGNGDNIVTFENKFLQQYWRNDRKNIQCFPFCPEYGDYYVVKTENLKHKKAGGTCGEPVKITVHNCSELKSDLIALGRISRDDLTEFTTVSVVTSSSLADIRKESIPGSISASDFGSGFEVAFVTSVWKLDTQLSKTRRGLATPPKQGKYFFEALLFKKEQSNYVLVARGESKRFSITSTRTLHRATQANNAASEPLSSSGTASLYSQPGSPNVVPTPTVFETMQMESNRSRKHEQEASLYHEDLDKFKRQRMAEFPLFSGQRQTHVQEQFIAQKASTNEQPVLASSDAAPKTQNVSIVPPDVASESIHRPNREQNIAILTENSGISLPQASLWCFFLGLFGAHHFYLHRTKQAFLYLFTFGLLGYGYIYDMLRINYIVSSSKIGNAAAQLEIPVLDKAYTIEAYILSIPLGLFGLHHFYMGKYKWGAIYLFTVGFCGVGLIYDLFTMSSQVKKVNVDRRQKYADENGEAKLNLMLSLQKRYRP